MFDKIQTRVDGEQPMEYASSNQSSFKAPLVEIHEESMLSTQYENIAPSERGSKRISSFHAKYKHTSMTLSAIRSSINNDENA